jgi:predicted enzyme related to lactoylglutathione lyase
MTPPHVSHVEWYVTDLARTEAFLSSLFGWDFEPYSRHYRLYTPPEGGTCVGLMDVKDARPCRSTLVHVQVNDIETYLRRAAELGGRIDSHKTEIPHYGWYAHVLDPDGNVVGLFQALS